MIKEKVFAVLGLGRFGGEVCRVLSQKGMKVIAVDNQPKNVEKLKDIVTQAVLVESNDEESLRNAGMQDVDVAVVAIGDNLEGSILTTLLLKNIGVPYIIARATTNVHAQVLKEVGATEIINLQIEEGKRLANRLVAPDVMDIIPISANQSMAELRIPEAFVDKTLKQLDIRRKYHINIISIKRAKTTIDEMGNPVRKETVISPNPEDVLKLNDVLVLLGEEKDIEKLKGLI